MTSTVRKRKGQTSWDRVAARRLVVATMLIVLAIGVVPLSGSCERKDDSAIADGAFLRSDIDAGQILEQLDAFASAHLAEPDEAFSAEVGLLPDAYDVRFDASACIVGFCVDGDVRDVADEFSRQLVARGFSAQSLGSDVGLAYLKTSGEISWVIATFAQMNGTTSVVVRYA